MAKRKTKRKSTRKRATAKDVPQHVLPEGFWQQAGAIGLVVLSLLLVVAWFGAGGPAILWVDDAFRAMLGGAVYIVPLLAVYTAIETFRAEDNRLPLIMRFATILMLLWIAGLLGVLGRDTGGGFFGGLLNDGMATLVSSGVATFIYVVLILITTLFVVRLSPLVVMQALWQWLKPRQKEDDANSKIMREAGSTAVGIKPGKKTEFKVNAGVPNVMQNDEATESKKSSRLSSLRGSVQTDRAAEERSALVAVTDPNWKAPSLNLLTKKQSPADAGDIEGNAEIIRDTLSEFNINVEMEGANVGPKVTQYELKPPSGVKLTKITQLETNIALNLAAQSLRIEAPIPGKRAVGIEVPNLKAADVRLRGILEDNAWKNSTEPLRFAVGKDIAGDAVVGELNKMPHLLIAGQTGSGKSVMINTLLTSLLYNNSPSEMKLILVDPKHVEMVAYEDIPHLLTPVITEPEKTISALKWAVNEMERRYRLLAEEKIKDIQTYNRKVAQHATKITVADEEGRQQQHDDGAMPYIVIVIDELADMMMVAARDVEALVVRLAQKARAVGIHLVLATQRPSVDVITGLIKANVPARIAFTVASQVDSRTILDQAGAEKLLGQGDMLMLTPSMGKPKRIQGAWVTEDEVEKITDHLRMQSEPQYNEEIISQPVQLNGRGGVVMDTGDSDDSMYEDAVRAVVEGRKASTSYLQRRLRIGYGRAARLIEEMEERGVIGPADGNRPRDVLVSTLDELGDSSDELA